MCLAQGHNLVRPVRHEPAAIRSRVKHSTTEPLRSQFSEVPEYAKMQFHITLLDVLGKIAWVSYNFLSQGKISDILIWCAKMIK